MTYPGNVPDLFVWMAFGSWLFWIALIALGIFAVVRFTQRPADRRNDPKAILDQRLARGEITPDEYRERLDLLKR